MKKMLSLVLAVLMVVVSVAAMAQEVVPSKTTEDTVVVNEAKNEQGGDVLIVVVPDNEEVQQTIAAFVEKVAASEQAPIRSYQETTQQAVAQALPEVDVETLVINEIIHINAPEYKAEEGKATARFTFPTVYSPKQVLVAVVSVPTGVIDEETGEEIVEEIVLNAYANEDGSVSVDFPADVLVKIQQSEGATMAILNTLEGAATPTDIPAEEETEEAAE